MVSFHDVFPSNPVGTCPLPCICHISVYFNALFRKSDIWRGVLHKAQRHSIFLHFPVTKYLCGYPISKHPQPIFFPYCDILSFTHTYTQNTHTHTRTHTLKNVQKSFLNPFPMMTMSIQNRQV